METGCDKSIFINNMSDNYQKAKDIFTQRRNSTNRNFEEYPLIVSPNSAVVINSSNDIAMMPLSSFARGTASIADSASYSSYSLSASYAPGSPSISASYALSASYAKNSDTASLANNAISSSYSPNISSSYSITASYALNGGNAGAESASWASSSISSSYTLTASYVLNGGGLTPGATYPITSSWAVSSSWAPSTATSTTVSSSWASSSLSASYAPNISASYALTASQALTASSINFPIQYAAYATSATSASYSDFAERGDWFVANVVQAFTGMNTPSLTVDTIQSANYSSISFTGHLIPNNNVTLNIGESNRRWENIYATQLFGTASIALTASYISGSVPSATSASWAGRSLISNTGLYASQSQWAVSASFASSSISASYCLSGS